MTDPTVLVDRPADGVARIALDRQPVNAVDAATFEALAGALAGFGDDVRCVILTATGTRAFSAGADLRAFERPETTAAISSAAIAAFDAVARCDAPLIGAINGPAIGVGAMLASQLDLLVAHRGVRFQLPEVPAGFPGGGSHLMRLAPWFKLQRMVLLGEPLDAEEALRLGTLAELVDAPAEVGPAALTLATRVAKLAPAAVQPARRILRTAGDEAARNGYRDELAALAVSLGFG